jgi:RHS repeat-associated protein
MNWTNTGNMAWEFAAPLPHSATVPTRTMNYDADNRLSTVNGTSVANDNNGNLTSGPLTNGTFTPFTYDARNRLTNVSGVTIVYDALNNRIGQMSGTNTTAYVINPNAKLPQVLMRIKNGVTNYYIYGSGLLYQITEKATGTNTLTYHYDYRGSTIALSADNGLVTDRIEYSAYGLTTCRAGTSDTPFLFNGRFGVQSDPNGLLYMRARYYSPYLCRFVNPDPSGFSAGMNFFAYANGNPTSLLDPFGLNAGTTGDTSFNWTGTLDNSTPYVTMTLDPNVNVGPQMGPPGFTPAQPYYSPNLPSTLTIHSPNDEDFYKDLAGGIQAADTMLFILSLVTPEGDVAAAENTGTALARQLGQAGEDAVGITGPKTAIEIPGSGQIRIPDALTDTTLTEVKNVGSLSYSQQLRDFTTYSQANGLNFQLWVRPSSQLSGPLQQAIANGQITLKFIPGAP